MSETIVPQATPKRKVSYKITQYTHVCEREGVEWALNADTREVKTVWIGPTGSLSWPSDYCPHCGSRLPQTEAELARAKE